MRIAEGEVVGLAGLLGSGRTETARMLFGIDPHDSGEVRVNGEPAPLRTTCRGHPPRLRLLLRRSQGRRHSPALSVRENLIFAMQASRGAVARNPTR